MSKAGAEMSEDDPDRRDAPTVHELQRKRKLKRGHPLHDTLGDVFPGGWKPLAYTTAVGTTAFAAGWTTALTTIHHTLDIAIADLLRLPGTLDTLFVGIIGLFVFGYIIGRNDQQRHNDEAGDES